MTAAPFNVATPTSHHWPKSIPRAISIEKREYEPGLQSPTKRANIPEDGATSSLPLNSTRSQRAPTSRTIFAMKDETLNHSAKQTSRTIFAIPITPAIFALMERDNY
jgi:hypothetical protein